jgi:hypothetical protein
MALELRDAGSPRHSPRFDRRRAVGKHPGMRIRRGIRVGVLGLLSCAGQMADEPRPTPTDGPATTSEAARALGTAQSPPATAQDPGIGSTDTAPDNGPETSEATGELVPNDDTSSSEKRVGDGCTQSDGWQVDEANGQLAPPIGALFCDSLGVHGYFTASCGTDADCPDGSKCDCGVGATCGSENPAQCRRPCTDDGECLAPHTCGGGSPVRYCKCGAGCAPSAGIPLAPE